MPTGRPTSYKKKYNKETLDHFSKGKTIAQLAAKFKVHRSTIYQWAIDNEEFSDTLRTGLEMAQAYWENIHHARILNQGIKGIDLSKVSERGLEFIHKTRFRNDYSEKYYTESDNDEEESKHQINIYLPDNDRK